MLSKADVYSACLHELNSRIQFFQKIIFDLKEGALHDAKSSAGDKHETAQSMMHLEQDKIRKQLMEAEEMKSVLNKFASVDQNQKIILGSLIKTNLGYFYLSVALGKLNVAKHELYVLSHKSPLGSKLLGLKINDSIVMNAKEVFIEAIY